MPMTDARMDELTVATDRRECLKLLLACVAFVAVSVWMLVKGVWFGWVGLAFFGPALVIIARLLTNPRPRLVFDERGVTDRTLGVGRIDYVDIEEAWLVTGQSAGCICLTLRDPGHYVRRASWFRRSLVWLNRRAGDPEFSLNLTWVEADADEVFRRFRKLWERARRAAAEEEGWPGRAEK